MMPQRRKTAVKKRHHYKNKEEPPNLIREQQTWVFRSLAFKPTTVSGPVLRAIAKQRPLSARSSHNGCYSLPIEA
jgi:hypothetical protein